MLLTIDVGNTNIVFGAYKGRKLVMTFRMGTNKSKTSDEYGVVIKEIFVMNGYELSEIKDVIISSVVPDVMHALESFVIRYCKSTPIIVGPGVKTGMNIKYENPQEVGADRIVNAVAGIEKYGAPLVIIDFGTATTYDVLKKGVYIGGGILPGIEMSINALYGNTAKLPRVKFTTPSSVLGTDTMKQIQAAIFFGYAGQIKHIIKKINEELNEEIFVLATGGLGKILSAEIDEIDEYDPNLSLNGLYTLYKLNHN